MLWIAFFMLVLHAVAHFILVIFKQNDPSDKLADFFVGGLSALGAYGVGVVLF